MEPDNHPIITNADLYERMNTLEVKMDIIFAKLEQASGAWMFVKIIGSMALGLTVMWNSISTWFKP